MLKRQLLPLLKVFQKFTVTTAGAALSFIAIEGNPAFAATFTVTNTYDSEPGSLRQAILDANAQPDTNIIDFLLVRDKRA